MIYERVSRPGNEPGSMEARTLDIVLCCIMCYPCCWLLTWYHCNDTRSMLHVTKDEGGSLREPGFLTNNLDSTATTT
jgi:hypothetical protein